MSSSGCKPSLVQRTPLTPVAGTAGPQPNQGLNPYNNIVFFSLRYYPFN